MRFEYYLGLSYLITVLVISYLSIKKKLGFWKAFFISLLLTPATGLFFYLASSKKIDYRVSRYKCDYCGFSFTEYVEYCPVCLKSGEKHKLRVTSRVMT